MKFKESKHVTILMAHAAGEPPIDVVRVFRIDWKDAFQYDEWSQLLEVRGYYIYPFEEHRVANITLHTTNTRGEFELRQYEMPELNRLDWWLAVVDQMFPVAGSPGRPVKRALEMHTTRQRRMMQKAPRTF